MDVTFTTHAKERCRQSNVDWRSLAREVSGLNVTGKPRWMTKWGTLVLERVFSGRVIIKTFIAKYKYKGQKYHKGCTTF
jgi:hypothetical protein